MSLIPAFEIGIWNAWIFMIYTLLPLPLFMLINRGALKAEELHADSPLSKTEKRISMFATLVHVLAIIYSIFLPLQLGTTWFYVGLPICLLGLVIFTVAMVNFATTPLDNKPSTQGVYRYSRHPMYFSMSLLLIGVSIASASWLFLLFSVVSVILFRIVVVSEERFCFRKYGEAYREYVNRTPRWIGVPKAGKID